MKQGGTANHTLGALWTLPNILTLIRIVLIPFFLILLLNGLYPFSLGVFALCGLTDAFDGVLARRTKQGTRLGSYLDPLADKLLIVSCYLALSSMETVPVWLTVLVLSRDLIILLGYGALFLSMEEKMDVQPSRIGKLNTGLQIATVALVLTQLSGAPIHPLLPFCFVLTAGVTAISGIHYIYRGVLWFQHKTKYP